MKKTIIISIGLLLLTTSVFALDPLGPPVATPKKNSAAIVGFEYLFGEMDLHSDSFVFTTHPILPALPITIPFSSATIKDVQSNKFYANLISEFGDDNFDFFLRLGLADANPDRSSNRGNLAGSLGDCDSDVVLGGGIRTTLFQSADGRTKWGLLAQLSYANLDYDDRLSTIDGYDVSLSTKIKMLEIQFATGPTYQLTDKFSIYGGPFLHFVKADADIKGTIDGESADGSTDIEQQSEFGGFIGLSTDLTKNSNFNAEFQLTDNARAVGFRFIHRF